MSDRFKNLSRVDPLWADRFKALGCTRDGPDRLVADGAHPARHFGERSHANGSLVQVTANGLRLCRLLGDSKKEGCHA
jgi:hypothetical protein